MASDPSDTGTRDASADCLYSLDGEDRIVAVDGSWCRFAEENGAPDLARSALGRPLWQFIADEETRSLYRQLIGRVRSTNVELSLPFRCDSPELRRYMELKVAPGQERDSVTCRTTLTRVEPRSARLLLDPQLRSGQQLLICSMCRRVAITPERWVEIEVAIRELDLCRPAAPRLVERVCGDCQDLGSATSHLVTLPDDYDESRKYPLVVFLHGAGQGRWLFRLQAPPRIASRRNGYVLLSPLRVDSRPSIARVCESIDEALGSYAVDPDRVYLTGISAGSTLAWAVAQAQPHRFAALLPIAGQGFPDQVEKLGRLPVWAFHGEADRVVSAQSVRDVTDALCAAGGNARLTVYPGADHDVWSRTYHDDLVWRWMLAQRRPGEQRRPLICD